ncbi:DNA-3-methyladenine glycosylase [Actinorhabdospora filicis]|uniref:DNA-3-methyladenine glycosylase n=2 Tax=Actinorhabdospora filicis TaxID=1785913 RepID=A0A9W6WAT8_9ACTN|nr:DNA-3-methyladenine glycosylase [Actinorhabdospora filicis]
MTEDGMYEAVSSRDARFDGEFFFAVTTTGIYCRPSCPATTPKRGNVRFYTTAAAAQGSGFRACRRCRPDAVPGSAAWNVRADIVGRAMRLIGDGVVDREGVPGLAARLAYSPRQVQRQLNAEVGAGPIALARAQRAHTARVLLQTTAMPAGSVAFAAGFASIRQFNDTVKEVYGLTPTDLRAARTGRPARGAEPCPGGIALRMAYRGEYDAAGVFDHLAARLIPGVEEITGERGARTYRRTLTLPAGTGLAEVDERAGRGWLDARLRLSDPRDLTTATYRVRRLFDLDADPAAVADRLGGDPLLAPLVAARPGVRSPGAVDPHEAAIAAVAGRSLAGLVARHGEPLDEPTGGLTHRFPAAGALTGEDGVVGALATALTSGRLRLDPGADRAEAERELAAFPIGPRTAGYIRMRALGDPDVLLAEVDGDAWRPWRSYATHLLNTASENRQH